MTALAATLDAMFQSTPPHGRRRGARQAPAPLRCFNPRLRTGGDVLFRHAAPAADQFQSTPPHGRRPRPKDSTCTSRPFQSTPPHGRRLRTILSGRGFSTFQSTPPHGRRPVQTAPARARQGSTFQSTPPHGRRPAHMSMSASACSCFNPRLRTGGDSQARSSASMRSSFNPRLRTGGDASSLTNACATGPFQSTPPHGRRRELINECLRDWTVSIHASAREATCRWCWVA